MSEATRRLTLVISHRPGTLIERLAADLAREPLPPLEEEVIVVQSLGMERWVRHELARRHGCAASLRFPFPAGFCHRLAERIDDERLDDRFGRDALAWRILELLERDAAEGATPEPLRRFVAAKDADTRKRLGLAQRLAARFDDYLLYRPDVLLGWERGEMGDVADSPHAEWQADLWRRLCAGEEPRHLARWFTAAVERLESRAEAPAGLPRRLTVFGVSTLPPLFARLLRAAARFVPVRVYVVAPPRGTWRERESNPLYAAFGAASRELLALLDAGDVAWEEHHEAHAASAAAGASCLARLQDDLRRGVERAPRAGAEPPVPLAGDDRSLSVHVCHSPMREMEVLRDQLLDAFASDATLRPHDVLVMVPDVAAYAPFVEAVFGVEEPGLPRIPHHVADRPIAHESSLADAAIRILHLVGARWTAPEVLELLDLPAVRRAAGISDGATARILAWVEETRIRWARDGAMRRDLFDLPAVDANSWRAGLDRLLMGYAVGPEDALVADVVPHAGHTIGDPETLGAFARWVGRLFDTLDAWRAPRTLAEWSAALDEGLGALLAPEDEREEQALARLMEAVHGLAELGTLAGSSRALDVAVVRDWLERALGDDSMGAGFLLGGMTVCALKPMRAIPFRVIAVAGLGDDAFPRTVRRAAYDLMELESRAGDRDLRADDRQLFLDTILSARDRLILSYVGRSARDNSERAPSVVVAELLDVVDRAFTIAPADDGEARRARAGVVVEHRLQPFSPAYFAEGGGKLFSYSRTYARALAASSGERRGPPAFVPGTLAEGGGPLAIGLADLIDCWTNPSRFFCRHVLGVRLPGEDEPLEECEPMEVDGLTRYGVSAEILRRHLAGARDVGRERLLVCALGTLPPGELATRWYDRIDTELADFLKAVDEFTFEEPEAIEVSGAGWTISGRVDGIVRGGRAQLRPAKCREKDLIGAWITHLALSAARGGVYTNILAMDGRQVFDMVDEPLPALDALVAGYRAALAAPLPVFEQASHAYVDQLLKQEAREAGGGGGRELKDPLEHARARFLAAGDFGGRAGDALDAYVALCWRGRDPFAEPEGFARWSRALWEPARRALREHEEAAE